MCPHRDWFTMFEQTSSEFVYMGNNTCKAEGIGTVRLKLHDGTVKDLQDVRYISDLKKSLISLSALKSKEYSITLKDGGLKVSLDNLVVMKGMRRKNLYFLQGSTVIENLAMASTGDDEDTTRLWHMRLGDPIEEALQGLVGQGLLKKLRVSNWILLSIVC